MLFQVVSPEVMNQAGSSIIKDTALGGFALICLGLAVWAIVQLKKVQDSRVDDKEKAADRLEAANEKDRAAADKLTVAVRDLANAQGEAGRAVTSALERQTRAIEENTRTLGGIVREAVNKISKGSGGYPATRPVRKDVREEETDP